MPNEIPYQRETAIAYASKWAYSRNPAYLDFADLGGDCTNFVSQCLYAGSGVMDYTPVTGWYYNTSSDRTASWTGVIYLGNYLLRQRDSPGPKAIITQPNQIQPGDVIQLGNGDGTYYHSLFVVAVEGSSRIYTSTHDFDSSARSLDSYPSVEKRYLHIEKVLGQW